VERQTHLALLLTLYLLPCTVQDLRTRHVSNWLTIPAFVAAWPLALWLGTLPFTLAVFAGCYVAWRAGGMGPADGKLAVLVAAVSSDALMLSGFLVALVFVAVRTRDAAPTPIAGVFWIFLAVSASALVKVVCHLLL
jgi:Flp pilus assembly protein protease CpaA